MTVGISWRRVGTLLRAAAAAILVVAGGVGANARLAAQADPQPGLPPAAIAELEQFLATEQAKAKVPGLQVAVAFRNQLVFSKGFGSADLENGVPIKPVTAFRTASLAKPLTATGVMQLVEQGKLDLDSEIQKYCPAFPRKPWPVTARELLGHLAGVRHYQKAGESAGTQDFFSVADSLAIFKNDPLLHEPGTKYFYSTFGFSILGCAIEGASGTSYEAYMLQHVFGQGGMTRTRLDRVYDIIPDRARGYFLLGPDAFKGLPPAAQAFAKVGAVYNAPLHNTSMKIPGGGLVSTAEDLVRFGIALQTGKLVTRATLEQMWTEGKTRSGESTGYGLGWGVQPPQDGLRRISHGGNQIGASSGIVIIPEIGLSFAVMTNLEDVEISTFTKGISQILRKHLNGQP